MSNKKAAKETIDMAKYQDSKPIVAACEGCENAFDYTEGPAEGTILIEERRCSVYFNPAAKWPSDESYVTKMFTVRKRDASGRAIALESEELPVAPKICPMATHVKLPEIVETAEKARAGQQKQKKR